MNVSENEGMRPTSPENTLRTQAASTLFLVRPDSFGFNPQTAVNNAFMHPLTASEQEVRMQALAEFTGIVAALKEADVATIVLPSPEDRITPDAVFPNNWITTHDDGTVVLFPMRAPNRRDERQFSTLAPALNAAGYRYKSVIDLTQYEKEGCFLEATGSLVLDRVNRVAFAIESPRTHKKVFDEFAPHLGYEPVFFHATDKNGIPVYHTNVIMTVGDGFVVLCTEAISEPNEKDIVLKKIADLGHELIAISRPQMEAYCGNLLQVRTTNGTARLVMSKTAYNNFTPDQIASLNRHGNPLVFEMETIETVGGGSARCVLAETFLPKKS